MLRATLLRLLRLAGALASLSGLLAVVRAPTHALWLLRVGVTEWGHLVAPWLLLGPLAPGWRRLWGRPVAALLWLAGLLMLTPLLRAIPVARRLPGALFAAFGAITPLGLPAAPPRRAPLVALDLARGIPLPRIAPRRLAYVTRGEQALTLHLYEPTGTAGRAPVVVVIHGGGWEGGDSEQLPDLNRYLAARGYAVAAITYRLSPRHPFPACYDDVLAAVAFLKERASELGIDAGRIALLGRSAGGHLALLAAYAAPDPAVRGVVAFYAPTDMRFGYANPARRAVIDSRGILERLLGGDPERAGEMYDRGSPLGFAGPGSPPTLLIHGARDEFVWLKNSEWLAARLAEAGVPHYLLMLPWATHGCDANLGGPGGQLSTYAVEWFLAAIFRREG